MILNPGQERVGFLFFIFFIRFIPKVIDPVLFDLKTLNNKNNLYSVSFMCSRFSLRVALTTTKTTSLNRVVRSRKRQNLEQTPISAPSTQPLTHKATQRHKVSI